MLMDERATIPLPPLPTTSPVAGAAPLPSPARRWDWKPLVLLLLLALGMRAWQLTHTEVAARDSIGYIRIAWQLEHHSWVEVVRNAPQHPLYPLTVLAVSVPVRAVWHGDLADAMQTSAQLAAALAGVLLVVPMFLLGRELFDRRIGFWGTLLFQTLPASGRLMADGLSEPLFLLLASSALLAAVWALRSAAPGPFVLVGVFSGLAYLTRPEGALVAAATGVVLLASQAVPAWRRSWTRCLICGTTLTVASLVVAGPYMKAINGLTVKPSTIRVFDKLSDNAPVSKAAPVRWATAAPLALWDVGVDRDPPSSRRFWGVYALGSVLGQGFFYVAWVPALLALVTYRSLWRREPGVWVIALVNIVVALALYSVAMVIGYLSDRHALLLLLTGTFWAVAGMDLLGVWIAELLTRFGALQRLGALTQPRSPGRRLAQGMLLVLVGVTAIKSLERLHADRRGFQDAGHWLACHAQANDEIVDPYAWAHFYAGRVFHEDDGPLPGGPGVCYIVVEESANLHSHLKEAKVAKDWAALGEEVGSWTVPRGRVAIYRVDKRFTPSA
jgi:hypothetical protein